MERRSMDNAKLLIVSGGLRSGGESLGTGLAPRQLGCVHALDRDGPTHPRRDGLPAALARGSEPLFPAPGRRSRSSPPEWSPHYELVKSCQEGRIDQIRGVAMRAPKNRKSALAVIVVVLTIAALTSCSESTKPQWEYAGVEQVRVLQRSIPESIAADDTLSILLWGDTHTEGRLSLSKINAVRESTMVGLTVWASIERWIGSGTTPPYDVTIHCEYRALPPFDVGQFHVVIHQPDGSQMVDSLLVEP